MGAGFACADPKRSGAGSLSRSGEGWGEGFAISGKAAPLTRCAGAHSTSPGRERWDAASGAGLAPVRERAWDAPGGSMHAPG
ncbi:hypothetical protein GCM10007888_31170 [Methylobacterium oxalidis]|uniref:Uncharacterized protein n=1 Tax=Methylobacterium oxalidis TaxID=944322 RepID=A0ABQ6DLF2_9HYPH|nr:hypothetical protein GCM10007888_31170 [Methylobacterium oxalidis]